MTSPTIPLNDLRRVVLDKQPAIEAAVGATLASGWWLNGKQLDAFCAEFERYLDIDAGGCIGVANGTDALELAMRALLGRQPGREFVTVANAGGYSTIAGRLVGLTPVYADIVRETQLASLESLVACVGAETAFVVVTHLYGGAVDVARLRGLLDSAGHNRVAILEDCAQAHGARANGRMVGTMGDIATFSFYPTKNLGAMGDGGAVVTGDAGLNAAVRALRQYGWGSKYSVETPLGRNSRLDEVQAAVLRVLLGGLDGDNARRRAIVRRYLAAAPAEVTVVDAGEESVGHLAVILADDRDALRAHLGEAGIQTDIHYPIPDTDQPAWAALPQRSAPGGLPVTRASVPQLLTLPCFPQLSDEEVERVCEGLARWSA